MKLVKGLVLRNQTNQTMVKKKVKQHSAFLSNEPRVEISAAFALPLAEIFFCRSACLYGQTGEGQSRRQTVQLGQNFKRLPNKSYCS
jgi:hypothetical protein